MSPTQQKTEVLTAARAFTWTQMEQPHQRTSVWAYMEYMVTSPSLSAPPLEKPRITPALRHSFSHLTFTHKSHILPRITTDKAETSHFKKERSHLKAPCEKGSGINHLAKVKTHHWLILAHKYADGSAIGGQSNQTICPYLQQTEAH